MSVRSRLAAPPSTALAVPVGKGFGTGIPPANRAGEAASQMTPASPFGPGTPIGPYDGFSRQPRTQDYVTGFNIATRPRTHERVSFETLRGMIESYDVAQICIYHRIDSIRSLDWKLVSSENSVGDVSDAIPVGLKALKKPDTENSFEAWLAKWLFDVLAYDAAPLYRLRNRAGKCVGLAPFDGTTVAPLLDYWGNRPKAPAEAYVQYVNGLPWNWLTQDDIIYEPFRPRTNSPYGHAPLESILLNANTDLRFQLHFLQRYCYDDQTEILTRDGWKRLPDVRGDEEFATRSADGEFQWQASKDGKLHVFDSGGTMVEFKNRYVDLLVTPNHRMLTRRKRQGRGVFKTARDSEYDWHIRRADEFLGKCAVDWRLPLTSSWTAPEVPPERFKLAKSGQGSKTPVDMPMWAFAQFLGLFIAEGNLRHDAPGKIRRWEICVSQMSGGKLDEVRRILKDTGLNWLYHSDARTGKFTVNCKALWTYLEQCGRGAWNKLLPAEVMDWPAELLEHVVHGLMTGDGTVSASGQRIYITTSRRLADQVQEIWQKCGVYSSVITKAPHPTTFGKRTVYQVAARRETEFQVPKAEAVQYDGNVYCVSVPNGIVLVRRNGKTMWCGNTDGNIPAAFASAPDSWSPDQIEQWQELWDGFMYGDQTRKNQIRWMPGGSKIMWSSEKDFTDDFSLFLLRKTAAAFHVVPADLGLTENVNKSSGDSQADVQHRVGDLPLIRYVQRIVTSFLQEDLGLPLKFAFDLGEEQADRQQQAQADKVYFDMGAVGASEIREMRYGLTDPEPIPRTIMTSRGGPIPIASLLALAGEVDPATGLPALGAALPKDVFGGVEGILPVPPIKVTPLAEREYGPGAMPPAPPPQPQLDDNGQIVSKEGEAAGGNVTAGITAETEIYGNPLIGADDDEDGLVDQAAVAKEMAAFRRFAKARRRQGEWRDFGFREVAAVRGHNLNDDGRLAVRKDAGEIAVAGLAVLAADTGRVLMIQRALDPDDPAGGKLEFPGGHLDGQESPLQGAWREFCEETGCPPPPGVQTGTWTSANGVYQGIVWTTDSEASVPVRGGAVIPNPDDLDGDAVEAVMWVDPVDLPANPMLRPELAANLAEVLPLLGCEPEEVAAVKAVMSSPKARPALAAGPGGNSI